MQLRQAIYRLIPKQKIPAVTFVASIVLTAVLVGWSVRLEMREGRREFQAAVERFHLDLSNQIQAYLDTLPTLKAFAVLEPHPSDARVARFADAVSLRNRFPNLAFVFVADHVDANDKAAYVASVRRDRTMAIGGHPQFAIFPEGKRKEYLVVRYVSPDIPGTVGYDLYDPSQQYRRDVDKAVLADRIVATGPIVLANDRMRARDYDNTSIVVRQAVFSDNQVPASLQARATQVQSVVGIAFKTKRLIESVFDPKVRNPPYLRIIDAEQTSSALALYQNTDPATLSWDAVPAAEKISFEIPVADRRWIVTASNRIAPRGYWTRPIPIIIAGAGAAISILLWILTRTLVYRTEIAEQAVEAALSLVRNEQAALEEAQTIAAIGSFEWRVDTNRLSWSAQMARLYGCTADAFVHNSELVLGQVPPEQRNDVRQALHAVVRDRELLELEHMFTSDTGKVMSIQIRSKWQYDDQGRACVLSGTAQEITALRNHEAEILRLAITDTLTGLPNRRFVIDQLSRSLEEASRTGTYHALLFLDLDQFKIVNDTRGHAVGDKLLALVGERIRAVVPAIDTVARIGGDEFVVLLMTSAPSATTAQATGLAVAQRLQATFAEPFLIEGHRYLSAVSIGVSVFPLTARTYADVFREGDTAMYRSKEAGRNRITVYEASMQTEIERRSAFAADLSEAVQNRQLYLVAQTQFDARRRPCGAELLLRWIHPSGETISPDRFIPVAEETGLIIALGAWVVEQGCKTVLALDAAGRKDTVSVNVSPRQFREPDFVDQVRATLKRLNVPPDRLIFEVTEGLLIENVAQTAHRMHAIRTLGVRFSIDDFGTGYSSLAYLRDLPLYELKIDKSFIRSALTRTNDAAIVRLILGIAAQLGIKVVAEGVETDGQFDFLCEGGCDMMQGFLLARPAPLDAWLRTAVPI